MSRSPVLLLAAVFTALLTGTANAEFQTFTDEASYLAAVSQASALPSPPSTAASSLQAAADTGGASGTWSALFGGNGGFSSLTYNAGAVPLIAFGGWFQLLSGSMIEVSLDQQQLATFTAPTDGIGFWGIVFYAGFNEVKMDGSGTGTEYYAGDFSMASQTGAVVPAPPSSVLFAIGMIGLFGAYEFSRRRRLASVIS
jgi:hypothetical protein